MRTILLAGLLAVVPPSYYTPQQAQTTLLNAKTAVAWVTTLDGSNHLQVSQRPGASKAACRGMGIKKRGAFPAFFCALQWSSTYAGFDGNAYVRVWSGLQACASARALADCPPPLVDAPLPGDPRCGIRSAECMSRAAKEAAFQLLLDRKMVPVEGMGCLPVTAFVYRCTWNSARFPGPATVRFVRGKTAWSVKTTLGE